MGIADPKCSFEDHDHIHVRVYDHYLHLIFLRKRNNQDKRKNERGGKRDKNRRGGHGEKRSSTVAGEKRKSTISFGTYLGNSLKDK